MQPESIQLRVRLLVRGIVQGVGFRPHVYRLARAIGLSGWVCNASDGVCIEVQGTPPQLQQFRQQLTGTLPELARIDSLHEQPLPLVVDSPAFEIRESQTSSGPASIVPVDLAPCSECMREMLDPGDRRYRYPFINCIQCGPRFTIMHSLPYDRPRTTMQGFDMCADCRAEYSDPLNRRYHAQPIACPACGPQVCFTTHPGDTTAIKGEPAPQAFREAIMHGQVIAVKGIGGFHLVCDAGSVAAVERLRSRKQRPEKPLAIMLSCLDQVNRVAHCCEIERGLLASRERPIVLLKKISHPSLPLAENLAPDSSHLGILLPYSPLHYLLVQDDQALVMTSGNLSDEPIVWDNAQAVERLGKLVDGFLFHDRPIHNVCDDSVVMVSRDSHVVPIRRSRGYAPLPVSLPARATASAGQVKSVLGVGGELKATFCLATEQHAFLSQHIGDMENLETVDAWQRNLATMQTMLNLQPQVVAVDMHPGYLSTQCGRAYAADHQLPVVQVQHHHAHLASLACEHQLALEQPLLGICFDGTGYGTDGTIWGGELLLIQADRCERLAHLAPLPLPGGDAAIRKPYRIALAYLQSLGIERSDALASVRMCDDAELRVLDQQLTRGVNCPMNSSMGRLFDAVAALLGLCQTATYEAQAAMRLEAVAMTALENMSALSGPDYRLDWQTSSPAVGLTSLFRQIIADMHDQVPLSHMALKFHLAVVDLIAQWAEAYQSRTTSGRIGLTGGVFQNGLLLDLAVMKLKACGLKPLVHRLVPCNDAGISLGQAWLSQEALASGSVPCPQGKSA